MEISSLLGVPIAWAPGYHEWLVIALLLVILFGAKRIPEVARGLGSGLREFKKAVREASEEEESKPTPEGGKKDGSSPGGNGSS
jgi:sec-independent protein translocase protein TatA